MSYYSNNNNSINESNGWPDNEHDYYQEQQNWEDQLAQANAAEENFRRRQAIYEAEQNAARQAARNHNVRGPLGNRLPNNVLQQIRKFEGPVENRYVNINPELPGNPWANNNNNTGAARKRKSTRRRKNRSRKLSRRQRKNRK